MNFKDVAKKLGSRGGYKTAETHSSEHYREMQRKGVEARLKRKMLLSPSTAQIEQNRA